MAAEDIHVQRDEALADRIGVSVAREILTALGLVDGG